MRLHGRFILIALSILIFTGCALDVVGNGAADSFQALLSIEGVRLTAAPLLSGSNPEEGWQYTSPDGDHFLFSRDFSRTGTPDLVFSLDADPFLSAGLNPSILPPERYQYDEAAGRLLVVGELSTVSFPASAGSTPDDTFREVIRTVGRAVGYHAQFDHYGISLGDGNLFEWAKDTAKNDKDVVFVLNPVPLMEAGLSTEALKGWTYAPVEAEDETGKMVQIHKLLRPYDLNK